MKTAKVLFTAGITGVVLAASVASPALAWHPKGKIVKYVQNKTTSSALVDANTDAAAVTAKPGDELRYVIEVSNIAAPANNGHNDLSFVVISDTLPAGVALVSNPGQAKVTFDLGNAVIKPGQKVAKEFTVKVTSDKDGLLIDNKACFTGDSIVKDNPQNGCDNAITKVNVPPKPPVTPPTPPQPPTPPAPTPTPTPQPAPVLPEAGASALLAPVAALCAGATAYAGRLAYLKRKV